MYQGSLTRAGAAWERVPEKLKPIAIHLGVVTRWSAMGWAATFESAIECEAARRAQGDPDVHARARAALIDLVASHPLEAFEDWTALAVSTGTASVVDQALALVLSHADLGAELAPIADPMVRMHEASKALRQASDELDRIKPRPAKRTRKHRLSRRGRGRW